MEEKKFLVINWRYVILKPFTLEFNVLLTNNHAFDVDWCDGTIETIQPPDAEEPGTIKLSHEYEKGITFDIYKNPVIIKSDAISIIGVRGDCYEKRDINVQVSTASHRLINIINPESEYGNGIMLGVAFPSGTDPDFINWDFSDDELKYIADNNITTFTVNGVTFDCANILEYVGPFMTNGGSGGCSHPGPCHCSGGEGCCHCPNP